MNPHFQRPTAFKFIFVRYCNDVKLNCTDNGNDAVVLEGFWSGGRIEATYFKNEKTSNFIIFDAFEI